MYTYIGFWYLYIYMVLSTVAWWEIGQSIYQVAWTKSIIDFSGILKGVISTVGKHGARTSVDIIQPGNKPKRKSMVWQKTQDALYLCVRHI